MKDVWLFSWTVVAACLASKKSSLEELTDVLARIGSWSQGWVDELMPDCRRTASV